MRSPPSGRTTAAAPEDDDDVPAARVAGRAEESAAGADDADVLRLCDLVRLDVEACAIAAAVPLAVCTDARPERARSPSSSDATTRTPSRRFWTWPCLAGARV